MNTDWISGCGLDCRACDIRRAPSDPEAADRMGTWFKEMGWLAESEGPAQVLERGLYCTGCRGDRSLHWSADCRILRCYVDEMQLQHCCDCDESAFEGLLQWAAQSEQYAAGLDVYARCGPATPAKVHPRQAERRCTYTRRVIRARRGHDCATRQTPSAQYAAGDSRSHDPDHLPNAQTRE